MAPISSVWLPVYDVPSGLRYRVKTPRFWNSIDMWNTLKNILIRAVQGNDAAFKKAREKTGTELRKLLEFLQADPAIVRLSAAAGTWNRERRNR